MTVKSIARRYLGPLPQWSPVGIVPPQRAVSVALEWLGQSVDVTENHVVASLKPLTLAIGLHGEQGPSDSATLIYRDNASGQAIGFIDIRSRGMRRVVGEAAAIALFEVDRASQRCLPWPKRHWNAWLQARAMRRNRNPHNFRMAPAAVQQLMTFYICPRPVVLVSVSEPTHSNIFPMDLIGPLGDACFTLALRSTSISVPTMAAAGRIAISSIGAEHKETVYALGEHHKKAFADWSALRLPTLPTPTFGIPAISSALRIRELAVEHSEPIGSHMFFVCRIISDCRPANGPQLHHTPGFYQDFRRRRGDAFPSA
jgi:flavin reductase (DIM6/NTAB) family NADH-FMN oxidoreductase RutF